MGSEVCHDAQPDTTRTVRLSWMVGCILSGIGYGALLVVGHACYVGLRRRSSPNEEYPRVKKVLIAYVVFTLILMTLTEVIEITLTVNSVLDDECFFQNLQPSDPYLGSFAIPVLLIDITTDGLLIWRCYTACGGLRGQRGWSMLLWVTPLVVYIVMICTGLVVVAQLGPFNPGQPDFTILFPILYGITGLLNVLITICIITLIIRYRRATTEALGKDSSLPYPNLMIMLVESASLVVFIDAFVVTSCMLGAWGNIAAQIWIPLQPMASFLIIHRVSQGSDYFHQQSQHISSLYSAQVSGQV